VEQGSVTPRQRAGLDQEVGTDNPAGIEDAVESIHAKGPDPDVWGNDEDRPAAQDAASQGPQGVPVGEIWYEGTEDEIKGPGPEWG
jgi:hypothetical protein